MKQILVGLMLLTTSLLLQSMEKQIVKFTPIISNEDFQDAVKNRDVDALEKIVKQAQCVKNHPEVYEGNNYLSAIDLDRAKGENDKYLKYTDFNSNKYRIEHSLVLRSAIQGVAGVSILIVGVIKLVLPLPSDPRPEDVGYKKDAPWFIIGGSIACANTIWDLALHYISTRPSTAKKIDASIEALKTVKQQASESAHQQKSILVDL